MILTRYWLWTTAVHCNFNITFILVERKNSVSTVKYSKCSIVAMAVQFQNGSDLLWVKTPLSQTIMDDTLAWASTRGWCSQQSPLLTDIGAWLCTGLPLWAIFLPLCNPQLQLNHENMFNMFLAATFKASSAGKDRSPALTAVLRASSIVCSALLWQTHTEATTPAATW